MAELVTLFASDPGRSEGDGVLHVAGLLLTGVCGVEGLRVFVFCVEVLPLLRLPDDYLHRNKNKNVSLKSVIKRNFKILGPSCSKLNKVSQDYHLYFLSHH